MFKDILSTGITDLTEYPKIKCKQYCKESVSNDLLCIPCEKPDIESVNEVKASICIENVSIINTILGPKIVISGVKNIKLIYTANNAEQSLHSSHWSIPFCEFILLKDMQYENCYSLVENVFAGIEYVGVMNCSSRYVDVCLIFIICPLLKEQYTSCCKTQCNASQPQYSPCDDYSRHTQFK